MGGVLYFIQGTISKNIKIGITGSETVLERMRQLNSSDLLVCLKTQECKDDAATEYEYHERFKASRLHSEWFKPTPDLVEFIASLPVSADTGVAQTGVKRHISSN
jgi:T5orf172 domain